MPSGLNTIFVLMLIYGPMACGLNVPHLRKSPPVQDKAQVMNGQPDGNGLHINGQWHFVVCAPMPVCHLLFTFTHWRGIGPNIASIEVRQKRKTWSGANIWQITKMAMKIAVFNTVKNLHLCVCKFACFSC